MDENQSRGYIQLGKNRNAAADIRFTNGMNHLSPPIDRCNCIYMALMLAGVGFLLPYNSFIIAVDYFQSRFPGTTIVFDMSLVYILMAFLAVLVNNLLVEALSLNTRITFGYVVSFFTLLFVATCEIWWDMFGPEIAYKMNLIAVAVVALGCTVQQSSFYGYTSMLPSRYTQAVMTGESAAGFLVSANRIITKLLMDDQRANTVIFFGLSVLTVALCFALHQLVRRSDFVLFYLALCDASNSRIVLEPHEDMGLVSPGSHETSLHTLRRSKMDPLETGETTTRSQYGVLKLQQSPPPATETQDFPASGAFSFANPVYEPGGGTSQRNEEARIGVDSTTQQSNTSGPTFKVEDVVVRMRSGVGGYSVGRKPWSSVRHGIAARWEVAKLVWPYMASIGLAYFVTLCLYPGIEAEIVSCRFGSWMPVILMAIFNAADLIGKVLASIPWQWSRSQLLGSAAARFIMVPLLLLCAAPRYRPFIPGDGFPMFFSALLGISNGIIGSVPMIQAPGKVPEEYRELTGNIMTLSYNLGLALGSSVAYLLDKILGPPILHLCALSPLGPHWGYTIAGGNPITSTTSMTPLMANITFLTTSSLSTVLTTPSAMPSIASILPTMLINATATPSVAE